MTNFIHVNYGSCKRKRRRGEKCLYCSDKPKTMAYTYFGAAVCQTCWDNKWRHTEDGECDPEWDNLGSVSGEYIQLTETQNENLKDILAGDS